jgi:ribosomal protein S18 acetylase RimI-like enzyme
MNWRVSYFSRIEKLYAEGGLQHLATAACGKLISRWVESGRLEFFSRGFEGDIPDRVSNPPVSIRLAGIDDTGRILQIYERSRSEEMIRKRFRRGDSCFIAINNQGQGVHLSWVSTRLMGVPELNLGLLLRPREVYNYDVYTRPDMRRRGIDSAARALTYQHLCERGYDRLYLYVRGENLAGLRAARRLLSPIGVIPYWRLRSGQLLYPDFYNSLGLLEEFRRRNPNREQIRAQLTAAIGS